MKTIIFISVFLITLSVDAQKQNDTYSNVNQSKSGISIEISGEPDIRLLAAKQLYVERCLLRYKKQRDRGFMLSVAGGAVAAFGVMESSDVISIGGGVLSLFGFAVSMNANNWLERASIQPTKDGAVFRFKF